MRGTGDVIRACVRCAERLPFARPLSTALRIESPATGAAAAQWTQSLLRLNMIAMLCERPHCVRMPHHGIERRHAANRPHGAFTSMIDAFQREAEGHGAIVVVGDAGRQLTVRLVGPDRAPHGACRSMPSVDHHAVKDAPLTHWPSAPPRHPVEAPASPQAC